MLRRSLKHWMSAITASAALVTQGAVSAFAEPPTAEQPAGSLPREILQPRAPLLENNGSWLRSSFHLQKKSGFAYTQYLAMSDRPMVFRVQGPVMREQKALGLTFKNCF